MSSPSASRAAIWPARMATSAWCSTRPTDRAAAPRLANLLVGQPAALVGDDDPPGSCVVSGRPGVDGGIRQALPEKARCAPQAAAEPDRPRARRDGATGASIDAGHRRPPGPPVGRRRLQRRAEIGEELVRGAPADGRVDRHAGDRSAARTARRPRSSSRTSVCALPALGVDHAVREPRRLVTDDHHVPGAQVAGTGEHVDVVGPPAVARGSLPGRSRSSNAPSRPIDAGKHSAARGGVTRSSARSAVASAQRPCRTTTDTSVSGSRSSASQSSRSGSAKSRSDVRARNSASQGSGRPRTRRRRSAGGGGSCETRNGARPSPVAARRAIHASAAASSSASYGGAPFGPMSPGGTTTRISVEPRCPSRLTRPARCASADPAASSVTIAAKSASIPTSIVCVATTMSTSGSPSTVRRPGRRLRRAAMSCGRIRPTRSSTVRPRLRSSVATARAPATVLVTQATVRPWVARAARRPGRPSGGPARPSRRRARRPVRRTERGSRASGAAGEPRAALAPVAGRTRGRRSVTPTDRAAASSPIVAVASTTWTRGTGSGSDAIASRSSIRRAVATSCRARCASSTTITES